jgi:hypothetical protein
MSAAFEPIRICYDGLDASENKIELFQLGQSLQGASRLLGIAGNFAITGQYIKQTPALAVRVMASEPARGSYEIHAFLMSLAPILPYAPDIATKVAEHIVTFILARLGGRPSEAKMAMQLATTAIEEMGATTRAQTEVTSKALDIIAEQQRPAARHLVAPVGLSCGTMVVGSVRRGALVIDKAIRDAIDAPEELQVTDERQYRVRFSEMDLMKKSCKVTIDGDPDPHQRYSCEITDPVLAVANNAYSTAMAGHHWIDVKAKAQLKNGEIDKLYISDTAA